MSTVSEYLSTTFTSKHSSFLPCVEAFANFFYPATVDPQIGIAYSGGRFYMNNFLAVIKEKFYIINKAEDVGNSFSVDVIFFNCHYPGPF